MGVCSGSAGWEDQLTSSFEKASRLGQVKRLNIDRKDAWSMHSPFRPVPLRLLGFHGRKALFQMLKPIE